MDTKNLYTHPITTYTKDIDVGNIFKDKIQIKLFNCINPINEGSKYRIYWIIIYYKKITPMIFKHNI